MDVNGSITALGVNAGLQPLQRISFNVFNDAHIASDITQKKTNQHFDRSSNGALQTKSSPIQTEDRVG